MATTSWGGSVNNTSAYSSYSNNFIYQDGLPMPTGRVAANGGTPIIVSGITAGYQSGASGMYAAINYSGSGNVTSGFWANSGGTFRFALGYVSGTMYFGRNTANLSYTAAVDAGDGTPFSGGAVVGSFTYTQVPTAPQSPAATGGIGQAIVTWTAPSSDGDSSITGYKVEYATNSSFTTGLSSITVGNVLTATVTGLTNGVTYWFRVYAINAVATAANTTSVASTVVSALVSVWTYSGSASYKVTVSAIGTNPNYTTLDIVHTVDVTGLDGSVPYSGSLHANYTWTAPRSSSLLINPYFDWLDSGGSVLSTVSAPQQQLYSGATIFEFANMAKPSLAVTGRFRINFPSLNIGGTANFTAGDVLWADAALLTNGPLIPFFDGSSIGASWSGTAGLSQSSELNPLATNVLYSAALDKNQIYSVGVNEVVTTRIKTTNFPTLITPMVQTETLPISAGQYYVIDSKGVMVTAALWAANGGSVKAVIGLVPGTTDIAQGTIDLIRTGPGPIPGYTEPFYFASGLATGPGETRTAQLSIAGSGVVSTPLTLTLATGADPAKTTAPIAQTVNIPFIDTLQDAYNRGVWAALDAAGPVATIAFDVSVNRLSGFGVTNGSLVRYGDSIYRIIGCTISGVTASMTASWYVRASEFEAIWASQTTSTFETLWSGYDASDVVVAPLRII